MSSYFYFTSSILAMILTVFFLYYTYTYLRKLEQTKCGVNHKKEIDILKNMELFLIIINAIAILLAIFNHRKINMPGYLLLFMGMFNIIFASVFVYSVYNLYHKMPKICYKTNMFPRYYLYLQAIFYLLSLLIFVIFGIMITYVKHSVKSKVMPK